jgi:transcription elongation factor Elf1
MKSHPIRLSYKCPQCDQNSFFHPNVGPDDVHGTADCGHCGALVLFEDGMSYDFNEKINERDARWPKDGKNTGYIKI